MTTGALEEARHWRPAALVTGASGGIGYELARQLAASRYDVVLLARNGPLLDRVASELVADYGVKALPLPIDLTDPEAPDAVFERLTADGVGIEILVNNAGFGTYGEFVDTDLSTELEMLQVNVAALTHLTKLFVRPMRARGRGRILNVASTAAFQPGPGMTVYFATKAYVLSFSEALAEELRGTGVTVTALCPGPTRTGFQERAAMGGSGITAAPLMADARSVAVAGYEGMLAGRRLVIPGMRNRIGAVLPRWLPRGIVVRVVRAMTRRSTE